MLVPFVREARAPATEGATTHSRPSLPDVPLSSVVGRLGERWREWVDIGASAHVVTWLREGVSFPQVKRLERKFFGDNGITKEEEVEWADNEISRLCGTGALVEVRESELQAVSPIRLAPKKGSKNRFRMIVNMRGVNRSLKPLTFKMEGLSTILQLVRPGDFLIKWDLREGYFHVGLGAQASSLCGIKWRGRYYRYKVLPFGCSLSPITFTKVVREMVKFFRAKGIRLVAYLDDFLAMFPSREEAITVRDQVILPTLLRLGFLAEDSKSVWEPCQRLEMLGLVLDSEKQLIEIPEDKLGRVEELARNLLGKERVTARTLARIAGTVISVSRAFPYAKMCTRELFNLIDAVNRETWEWEEMVTLSPQVREDAQWLLDNVRSKQGMAMWKPSRSFRLFSDASLKGWGGHLGDLRAGGSWSEEERRLHINTLEVLAAERVFETFGEQLRGRRVTLVTDSMTARKYLENAGGRDELRNQAARRIWTRAVQLDILLSAEWLAGALNSVAEEESRSEPRDDWMVKKEVFRLLDAKWGPHSFDRMADEQNHQVQRFNSRRHCPGTAGVDTFSQDWSGHTNWVVPSFALVGRVLQHLAESGARATVVVPEWQAQPWWPLLLSLAKDWHPLKIQDFEAGPSGFLEPAKNGMWRLWAVRI